MRKAAISCWNLVSPFAAGIGIASAAVSFIIGLYYNTMVAWTLLYLWDSASQRPLPFAACPAAQTSPTHSKASPKASDLVNNSSESECQVRDFTINLWLALRMRHCWRPMRANLLEKQTHNCAGQIHFHAHTRKHTMGQISDFTWRAQFSVSRSAGAKAMG